MVLQTFQAGIGSVAADDGSDQAVPGGGYGGGGRRCCSNPWGAVATAATAFGKVPKRGEKVQEVQEVGRSAAPNPSSTAHAAARSALGARHMRAEPSSVDSASGAGTGAPPHSQRIE